MVFFKYSIEHSSTSLTPLSGNFLKYSIKTNSYSNISKQARKNIPNLGRWSAIINENVNEKDIRNIIDKNANWGNHVHCGSEICKTHTKEINVKEKNNTYSYLDDPYWPYVM